MRWSLVGWQQCVQIEPYKPKLLHTSHPSFLRVIETLCWISWKLCFLILSFGETWYVFNIDTSSYNYCKVCFVSLVDYIMATILACFKLIDFNVMWIMGAQSFCLHFSFIFDHNVVNSLSFLHDYGTPLSQLLISHSKHKTSFT